MDQHEKIGRKIHIRGIVQGVGFRPFVYQTAVKNHLTGWVCNTSRGVEIEVFGEKEKIEIFTEELQNKPPSLSRIDEFTSKAISIDSYTQFDIIESISEPGEFIPISPDISICSDCLREMFDPSNRRYRYPFINCTNCGPRFSIIKNIPYDRPYTTMSRFSLCPECQKEYNDPFDRRFHAQPTACSICGPSLKFIDQYGNITETDDEVIKKARDDIQLGKILAVKGLGGYHLACDATNRQAVELLRGRKRRVDKPFALMAASMESISHYCTYSQEEKEILESRQRPIVLLKKKNDCNLPDSLAPGQNTLGFMLPYTPVHYLLMERSSNFPDVLVMTSGNFSEEPIAYEDSEAMERLSSLADSYLTNNREIHMRVDDSVMRVVDGSPVFVRRSRGFAPDPIQLPFSVDQILATGAELKNHFTFTRNRYAFVSHYIGDLDNIETIRSFEQAIAHFKELFRVHPEIIACDLHPDYFSTRYAFIISKEESLPLIQVQHHHAHLAACLVENGWDTDEPVIGLSFDGTGFGTDNTIWGGEVLVGGYLGYERRFHLESFPLPGGDKAAKDPARTAISLLSKCQIEPEKDFPPVQFFNIQEMHIVQSQINQHINAPLTSSMGRLFDGIAALIGIRQRVTYEGQAAIELEAIAYPEETGAYSFEINQGIIDYRPVIRAVVKDLRANIAAGIISARFHNGIVNLCLDIGSSCKNETGLSIVALSGGVWQNMLLLSRVKKALLENGFTVFYHQKVPTNDACISLGQAAVAARRKK